jgi:signal transduction histidine kinase
MEKPAAPPNEHERLSALANYEIDYHLPDSDYQDLTRVAAQICQTSQAFISLISEEQQCFLAQLGFSLEDTPREHSFCAHLLTTTDEFMVVPDAREDSRFHDNPYVTGYPYIVFYAGAPLINEAGFRLGTLCVVDAEPGYLNEHQINALQSLAKQVVAQMDLQKQKKELDRTRTTLQQKNQELEEFAHRAAHDIKSPLKNLTLLADYLKQAQPVSFDEEGGKWLTMIKHSSQELENLVEGILTYSKGDQILSNDMEAVELPAFFGELKSLLDASDTCAFHYPTDQQTIYTNKTAFKQILTNLVSNAIKYGDKAQPVIKLDFEAGEQQYHFWITDNGPGISEAYQEQIFQMFEVLSNKDQQGQKGTGIGLATVKKLVEGLGGHVEVSSTPGAGTTFRVSLKRAV